MIDGRQTQAEHLLARVERGEITPVEALTALRAGRGQVSPPTSAFPVAPAMAPTRRANPEASRQASHRTELTRPASSPSPTSSPESTALQELDRLIGLDRVKDLVRELQAFVEIGRRRRTAGLKSEPQALHMAFKGNPGTGKTTVARIIGRLLKEMGVLEKGHLIEVERADLVGEYIGHTAQKVREQIKKALGGILFVDEAYSLARGGEKDFGKEAIDALVKAMEDHRYGLVLILAGYRDETEWFLRQNPGLRSRFPIHMDFPDYTADELLRIASQMAAERDYVLTEDARRYLIAYLESPAGSREWGRGNARLIRNLLEKAIRRQAVRLLRLGTHGRDELMLLTHADVEGAIPAAVVPEPWGTGTGNPFLVARDLAAWGEGRIRPGSPPGRNGHGNVKPARNNGNGAPGGGVPDALGE